MTTPESLADHSLLTEAQKALDNPEINPVMASIIVSLTQRLTVLEEKQQEQEDQIEALTHIPVSFFEIEGGKLPEMKTKEAIGYDAHARAIVDPRNKKDDDKLDYRRLTLVDFENEPADKYYNKRKVDDPDDPDRYGIAIPIGGSELVGLGFCTAMRFPAFFWVSPRSGLASRGITVSNSPGTVDADYRGESGVLLKNTGVYNEFNSRGYEYDKSVSRYFTDNGSYILTKHQRITQTVFALGVHVIATVVENHEELGQTERGSGGFGSTGLTG